jgi:hypothetical protein
MASRNNTNGLKEAAEDLLSSSPSMAMKAMFSGAAGACPMGYG